MKRSWVRVNFPPPSFSLSLSRCVPSLWFLHVGLFLHAVTGPCNRFVRWFHLCPLRWYTIWRSFTLRRLSISTINSQPQDTMSRMKQLEETPQAFQGRAHRSRGSRPHLLAPCRERWWNRNSLREMMRVAEFLNAIQNGKSGHSKIQTVHFYLRFGPSHLDQHPTQKKVFS